MSRLHCAFSTALGCHCLLQKSTILHGWSRRESNPLPAPEWSWHCTQQARPESCLPAAEFCTAKRMLRLDFSAHMWAKYFVTRCTMRPSRVKKNDHCIVIYIMVSIQKWRPRTKTSQRPYSPRDRSKPRGCLHVIHVCTHTRNYLC